MSKHAAEEASSSRRNPAWLAGSALVAVPLLCLAFTALTWLRFGVDFPLWDDWRDYRSGEAGSFDLAFLFRPANDTLFPVGRVLDSIALRLLDGNTIAYQFSSMVAVLGLLLLFQWKLLRIAVSCRLHAAVFFTLTLWMLQPESYWGWQNIAYHQAIPLVCILAALLLVLGRRWHSAIGAPLVFLLGLVSGFVYISGAFAAVVAGATLLGIGVVVAQPDRTRFRTGGAALLLAGVPSAIAQLNVIVVVQQATHRHDAPLALPIESDFWWYMLGKIGRAMMLPPAYPRLSLVLTLAFVALVGVLTVLAVRRALASRPVVLRDARAPAVFLTLLGVIFVYLLMISAGRTNLRPADLNGSLQIFSFGFLRFHYFWVTLLLPWVAALAFASVRWRKIPSSPAPPAGLPTWGALTLAGLILAAAVDLGAWRHPAYFRQTEAIRLQAAQCMTQRRETGLDVPCSRADLEVPLQAFDYGVARGASFGRTVPLRPVALDSRAPVLQMAAADWLSVSRRGADVVGPGDRDIEFRSSGIPQFVVAASAGGGLQDCRVLDVALQARWSQVGQAKLEYLPAAVQDFSDAWSSVHEVPTTEMATKIHFLLNSASGFQNRFRLTPTSGARFALGALEMRCLETARDAPAAKTLARTMSMRPSSPIAQGALPVRFSRAHLAAAQPLRKVNILFGTWARRNDGIAELRLRDANDVLFTTRFDLADLVNNAYREFVVDPRAYVSGEIVALSGGGVSVWESVAASASCLVYEYADGVRRHTPGCLAE